MPPETFTYPLHVVTTEMAVYRLLAMQEEMEKLLRDLDRAIYLAEPLEINADDDRHEAWEEGLVLEAKQRMAVLAARARGDGVA